MRLDFLVGTTAPTEAKRASFQACECLYVLLSNSRFRADLAQLDRALASEAKGHRFKSCSLRFPEDSDLSLAPKCGKYPQLTSHSADISAEL